jgi:hypothetical protein
MYLAEIQAGDRIPLAIILSLIAIAISIFSIILTINRDIKARRLLASEKIRALLQIYNESLRIIDQIKSQIRELDICWKDCKHLEADRAKKYISKYENMGDGIAKIHEKIKSIGPNADPVKVMESTFEAEALLTNLLSMQDSIKWFGEKCPPCSEKQKKSEQVSEQDKEETPSI